MNPIGLLFRFIFDFLFSIYGVFTVLCGMLLFLVLPIIPAITGEFRRFGNFALWLSTRMFGRLAVVVSEHEETVLKSMSYDENGVEKMSMNGEEKEFEDPDGALHHWFGIPFSLAEDKHGTLFDPRHAALGTRKKDSHRRGEYSVDATESEHDRFGVLEWKKALFEFPRDVHELVTLGDVRQLIDGGERAEYAAHVEDFYKKSRDPYKNGTGAAKIIMIVVALLAPFALMWFISDQMGGGGGGGTTISFGSILLMIGMNDIREKLRELKAKYLGDGDDDEESGESPVKQHASRAWEKIRPVLLSAGDAAVETFDQTDKPRVAKLLGVIVPVPAILFLLAWFVNPIVSMFVFFALGIGFFTPLIGLFLIGKAVQPESLARLVWRLGMVSHDRVVFEWTPSKYVLRSYDEIDECDVETWYSLEGTLVGFTFEPSPDSWGAEVEKEDVIESAAQAVADGGEIAYSNIPAGFQAMPEMTRARVLGGMVPETLEKSKYYLNTAIANSRFADTANGEKALNRLVTAKNKHGDDKTMSDESIAKYVALTSIMSFVSGILVFFVL